MSIWIVDLGFQPPLRSRLPRTKSVKATRKRPGGEEEGGGNKRENGGFVLGGDEQL
jgi:hypothetical protein